MGDQRCYSLGCADLPVRAFYWKDDWVWACKPHHLEHESWDDPLDPDEVEATEGSQ